MSEQESSPGKLRILGPEGARRCHIIFTAAVVALAAILLYTCLTTLRYRGQFGPGPGFVPTWNSLILLIISRLASHSELAGTVQSRRADD